MRVAVIGASGFIGRHLVDALRARADEAVPLSLRDPAAAGRACEGADVVVNLAGEPVAQRWTDKAKASIRSSRVDDPRALIAVLATQHTPPEAYISASAIGYYGTSETAILTEASPPGNDFLAEVCVAWEDEAARATEFGMRVAIVRTGLVLGADGGALAKLLPIFRLGGGGRVASGAQWYSWIHIDDMVGIYLAAIDGASGVLNATAPHPVRNRDFASALARAVKRPAFFPIPEFTMNLLFGEGAVVVTKGQRVLPERTSAQGYTFRYPEIEAAFAQIVA
jgi:uncharacterized protein (TIGR01777 family)